MTTIVPQEPLISALETQWKAIDDLVSPLSDAQWTAASPLPGWQIRDIVAHIAGTESMLAGRQPESSIDTSQIAHVKNPIGELNERWIDHYRSRSRDELMTDLRTVTAERSKALRGMTEGQWDAETATPAGPDTYGRFMRVRDFDCWVHEIDIRDALGLGVPENVEPAHWALREIESSMPYVVGKKARAEVGSTVRFDITGLYPFTFFVVTEDRAAVVPAVDGEPDVTLRLDGLDLARSVGGRPSAGDAEVEVTGDTELGAAIIRSLHYLI
ncbi:maleylpyruvate isomerase family mycothiol-dependent enzyme [Gordonia sihwensis]|uniref:maleylpyruvate isomerase family mycothiol-dependent enzyme n=1 Tax=Gordonia TaxID=2053 RepID=UPI002416A82F|nr:maleylpyruvate isomerase family mycothiol-dependent enzyme [Gordonia sihwensis]WFN91577.1 maleylpyruvate isomerase family mycothiol-dependent enzyme [Gordonia sihwensis]